MQKFRIMSDLHLEFDRIAPMAVPVLPTDKDTILILAGDVHTGNKATEFLKLMLERYQEVIYVLGNHEFYHEDMEKIRRFWQQAARYKRNLHVLDPGVFVSNDNSLRIIGTTLWTATNDPAVETFLNDYACIYHNGEVLNAQGTRDLYLDNLDFIQAELETPFEGTTIVVTHHAPIAECVNEKYVGHEMNKCFHNNLNWLIEDNDIDLWVHGHMHDTNHFTYYGTEIYCNPRGYVGYESNVNFDRDTVFEV